MAARLIYWDSMCFTYRLKRQKENIETLEPITQAAQDGNIVLVTSIFTMAEVACVSDSDTAEEQERQIELFFENDYIYPIPFDVAICKKSRELVRLCHLKGKDAVHVASALSVPDVSSLHTHDKKVINAYNGLFPNSPLRVETPDAWSARISGGTGSLFAAKQDDDPGSNETQLAP
jgi:predicted nucleic acid-binding protein